MGRLRDYLGTAEGEALAQEEELATFFALPHVRDAVSHAGFAALGLFQVGAAVPAPPSYCY
jgi:hypothetical protein